MSTVILNGVHSADYPEREKRRHLTTAEVLRWTSYSAAQLPLLVRQHGFPLPIELSHLGVGWAPDEVGEWIQLRNQYLLSRLI